MYSLLIVMCEEEFVENAVIQLFDLSNYSDSLPTEAKECYLSKLADIVFELINAHKRELSVTEKPMQWMKKTSRPVCI
ncbi:hypothetical protein GHT06_011469 [Daphnia sinensis]|uniref:Uncharacterized protein n=1 Tax=Daphnia sinensis TaxID=1820382 RepID=A0AAD5PXZ0_9CRUS|nr:hypothetical protein GHT06_011469 [Daphnia sinensis]